MSKGWFGSGSDQHIGEKCGILGHLLPGDLILADRGFNFEATSGLHHAEV